MQEHEKQRKRIVDSVLSAYERLCIEDVSRMRQRQRAAATLSVASLPSIVEDLPPSNAQLTPGLFNSSKALIYQRKYMLQQAVMRPMMQELKQLEVHFGQQAGSDKKQMQASQAALARQHAAATAKELALADAARKAAVAAKRQRNADAVKERERAMQAERSAQAEAAQAARLDAAAAAASAVQQAKATAAVESQLLHTQRAEKRRKQELKLMCRVRKRQSRERAKAEKQALKERNAQQQEAAEKAALEKEYREQARALAKQRAAQLAEKRRAAVAKAATQTAERIEQLAAKRAQEAAAASLEQTQKNAVLAQRTEAARVQAQATQRAAAERHATRLVLTDMIAEKQRLLQQEAAAELRIRAELRAEQRQRAVRRAKRKRIARRKQRERALQAKHRRIEQLAQEKAQSTELVRAARHEAEMTRATLRAEILAAARISPEEVLRRIEAARAQVTHDLEQQSSVLLHQESGLAPADGQLSQEFSSILSISSLPRGNSAVEQLRNLQADMSRKYDAMAAAVGKKAAVVGSSALSENTAELLGEASRVGLRAGVSWALGSASTTELLQTSIDSSSARTGLSAARPPAASQPDFGVRRGAFIPAACCTTSRLNMDHPLLQQKQWLKPPSSPKAEAGSDLSRSSEAGNAAAAAPPLAPSSQAADRSQLQYEQIGYFDNAGKWQLYDDVGFYDDEGKWQFYEGYYDNDGEWHAYTDEGYYDSQGQWHEYVAEHSAASTPREDGVEGLPDSPLSSAASLDSMLSVQQSSEQAQEFDAAMQEALKIRQKVWNTRSTLTTLESDWDDRSRQSTEVGPHQQKQLHTDGSLGEESALFAQAYSMSAYRTEPNS